MLAASGASAHVLVDDVEHPALSVEAHHHLTRVVRLRPGAVVTVGDGKGLWRMAQLRTDGSLESTGLVVAEAHDQTPLTVACALTKGDKPDLVVQKLTEIGIDRIVLFPSARSVVRWDESRAQQHIDRLRRVAVAAVQQCRRAWLPTINFAPNVTSVLGMSEFVVAQAGGRPVDPVDTSILIGPEGGWDRSDGTDGLSTVSLGPHILRAETAAIVAGAVLVGQKALAKRVI